MTQTLGDVARVAEKSKKENFDARETYGINSFIKMTKAYNGLNV